MSAALPTVIEKGEFADRTLTGDELSDVYVAEGSKWTPRYDAALKAWFRGRVAS